MINLKGLYMRERALLLDMAAAETAEDLAKAHSKYCDFKIHLASYGYIANVCYHEYFNMMEQRQTLCLSTDMTEAQKIQATSIMAENEISPLMIKRGVKDNLDSIIPFLKRYKLIEIFPENMMFILK